MALLEVEDLEVRYGGAVAVRGISLHVDEGEVAVVLGANGAGKTSTLRAIAGQLKMAKGTVRWIDHNITSWPAYRVARSGLVMVPEGRKVFAPLSVKDNLTIGGYTNHSKSSRVELLERIFKMFPILEERQKLAAGYLSGGEQQMLAFGRAMMADPRVILLDEPSMGLSPSMVDSVMASIGEIAKTGIGILMVEQNAMAALTVARRAVVLEQGVITLEGSSDEIRHHPDIVKAFLGDAANKSVSDN
jgi:branched-chain amino acid transport system ATP-binding protein